MAIAADELLTRAASFVGIYWYLDVLPRNVFWEDCVLSLFSRMATSSTVAPWSWILPSHSCIFMRLMPLKATSKCSITLCAIQWSLPTLIGTKLAWFGFLIGYNLYTATAIG